MTATGFIGMLIGFLIIGPSDDGSVQEFFGIVIFLFSAIAFCAGVFIWLWRVMP